MSPLSRKPERTGRLADRLAAVRRGRLVGRTAEIALFREALAAAEPPFAVLFLSGPGGVGKTTLLREYARLAAEAGRPVVSLDGHAVDPSPSGFLRALCQAMDLPGATDTPALAGWPPGGVLLIDTYETLAPLDAWLRETFLPQLSAESLVVIAGRTPPAPAWRTELDWADLVHRVALGNLAPEESRSYLTARGIPDDRHPEALAFTRGHPLALALVADVMSRGDGVANFAPRSEPEVVRALLERLVEDVPSTAHRLALQVCALARVTTMPLLGAALAGDDPYPLFEWLRGLSFIEQRAEGLFPHDLAREALDADAHWRDPERRRELSRRIYRYLRGRIAEARGPERQQLQLDALYAIRTNPVNQPYFDWEAVSGMVAEPAVADDTEAILAMVQAHEGAGAAAIARHWLARQPEAFLVFRDGDGQRFGFMALLALHRATPEDRAIDPAVGPALDFVARHGPVHPGEHIIYLRFWMHRQRYQAVTAAINLTAMNVVTYWATQPDLAWSFIAMAAPDFWQPHLTGVNSPRVPAADFVLDGHRYGVFAHDWRVEPASAYFLGRHVPMPFADPAPGEAAATTLSRAEFATAVRQALRDYTRPDRLARNPLTRTGLVAGAATDDTATMLRSLLREATGALKANPNDTKLYRALWHTYFEPAPTQEQAAEILDLPFNTYRYHLARGIERVTDWLWHRHLTAPGR